MFYCREWTEMMALMGKWYERGLSCYFMFLKYGQCGKMLVKSEKCFGGEKDIASPLRSQLQQLIHLAHCYVNVPANGPPLCRLRYQDTFILLWMDRITYSKPLCFRGEEDQTSLYCKADLEPFNCLSQTQWSRLHSPPPCKLEQFPGTFTVMYYNICTSSVITALITKTSMATT